MLNHALIGGYNASENPARRPIVKNHEAVTTRYESLLNTAAPFSTRLQTPNLSWRFHAIRRECEKRTNHRGCFLHCVINYLSFDLWSVFLEDQATFVTKRTWRQKAHVRSIALTKRRGVFAAKKLSLSFDVPRHISVRMCHLRICKEGVGREHFGLLLGLMNGLNCFLWAMVSRYCKEMLEGHLDNRA
jgi:hypothetical protein